MRIPQRLGHEDGAAAVEFALIVGVLAMLIFGMLQFGLTFFELQNLRASAREGGRLGAVGATPDQIRARIESASNGAIGTGEASYTSGGLPFVKITYSDSGSFTGGEGNLTGSTSPACSSNSPTTTDAGIRIQESIAQAPAHLRSLFILNIPFLPQISMTPTIDAQFRCEGVKAA